jgi:hypothetical protein
MRMTRDPLTRQTAVIPPGQISLVLEGEEEAMRIAQAIPDRTGKCVILTDANGLELGRVKGRGKPSRTDQARQRPARIIKKLRKQLN